MPHYRIKASTGFNFVTAEDEVFYHDHWADDEKDIHHYYEKNWKQIFPKDAFLVSCTEIKTHGGYRPGGGRKPLPPDQKAKPKTVAKRIPVELAEKLDKVQALLALVEDWKERSEASSTTSPRWDKLREFLGDVENLGL